MQIQKTYLHELLKEDQEPFHLKNYIADRRSHLSKSHVLQIIKHNPVIQSSSKSKPRARSFCKYDCFLDSPVVTKSKTSDFLISKSNCPSTTRTGSDYLRIPATTSDLLLEAATRIKKKQVNSKPGLFSSVFKKLKDGSKRRSKKSEIGGIEAEINHDQLNARVEAESSDEEETTTFYCSCNFSGRPSSAGLSEINERRRSLDIDQTSSSSSWRSENSSGEIEFVAQEDENRGFSPSRKRFWSSPLSPSRFSPRRSTSPGRCSVVLSSPAISPCRRKEQEMNVEVNSSANIINVEKQQSYSSPISVLDPQLETEHEEDDEHQKQDYDATQCSFDFVDSAKEQLLYKLRRFEKLANLDPVELEKRMVEQLNDESQNVSLDDDELEDEYMQVERGKLLVEEERSKTKWLEKGDILLGKVCSKMDCWGEEISYATDMMIQRDFKNELDVWKRCQEQREESGMEIELAIFGFLVEEFVEDLMKSSNSENIVMACASSSKRLGLF